MLEYKIKIISYDNIHNIQWKFWSQNIVGCVQLHGKTTGQIPEFPWEFSLGNTECPTEHHPHLEDLNPSA